MSILPTAVRILIALFLIAHGLVHMIMATIPVNETSGARDPYFPSWWRSNTDPAWPASRLGLSPNIVRTAGYILWMAALVLFLAAGLGLLGVPGLRAIWVSLAAIASVVSLVMAALFWNPNYVGVLLINLAILAVLYLRWPAVLFPAQ